MLHVDFILKFLFECFDSIIWLIFLNFRFCCLVRPCFFSLRFESIFVPPSYYSRLLFISKKFSYKIITIISCWFWSDHLFCSHLISWKNLKYQKDKRYPFYPFFMFYFMFHVVLFKIKKFYSCIAYKYFILDNLLDSCF